MAKFDSIFKTTLQGDSAYIKIINRLSVNELLLLRRTLFTVIELIDKVIAFLEKHYDVLDSKLKEKNFDPNPFIILFSDIEDGYSLYNRFKYVLDSISHLEMTLPYDFKNMINLKMGNANLSRYIELPFFITLYRASTYLEKIGELHSLQDVINLMTTLNNNSKKIYGLSKVVLDRKENE